MKKLLLLTILLIPAGAFSQSIEITPRSFVYKRSVPAFAGRDTAEVTRPVIKARTPALTRRIEKAIGFDTMIGLGKNGLLDNDWLDSAEYRVDFNQKGILSILITMTGTGASETTLTRSVVIDTGSGRRITLARAFSDIDSVVTLVGKMHANDVAYSKAMFMIYNSDFPVDFAIRYLEETRITEGNLENFSVNEHGITFYYDYSFPRYIRALEPAGIFLVPWKELKSYLRRGGLLKKELVH